MKSSPHAHSHGVRSITLVLALSFHELIEGVAFGVQVRREDLLSVIKNLPRPRDYNENSPGKKNIKNFLIHNTVMCIQKDVSKVTALFLSLLVHKLIVAFSTGLQLARTHAHQLHLVVISVRRKGEGEHWDISRREEHVWSRVFTWLFPILCPPHSCAEWD